MRIALALLVANVALLFGPIAAPMGAVPLPRREKQPSGDWPMLGRTPQRNVGIPHSWKIPAKWNVRTGANIKWSVQLGSRAYGGPIIAGGRIFIGTNNELPRDPAIKGDKGILMCFRESDGKFLWQAVHDKLRAGRIWDWPQQGVCSYPCVEGDRLYYVSNRCELVCADVNGDGKGGAKFHWKLDVLGKLGVFPHNLAVSSPLIIGDPSSSLRATASMRHIVAFQSPTPPASLP